MFEQLIVHQTHTWNTAFRGEYIFMEYLSQTANGVKENIRANESEMCEEEHAAPCRAAALSTLPWAGWGRTGRVNGLNSGAETRTAGGQAFLRKINSPGPNQDTLV